MYVPRQVREKVEQMPVFTSEGMTLGLFNTITAATVSAMRVRQLELVALTSDRRTDTQADTQVQGSGTETEEPEEVEELPLSRTPVKRAGEDPGFFFFFSKIIVC